MYLAAFALLAIATSSGCPAAAAPRSHPPQTNPPPAVAIDPNDLYSAQARRRMVHYLRLRLMELNAAELQRVAKVVRGELSVDDLLQDR
jgi:hypothetical protein